MHTVHLHVCSCKHTQTHTYTDTHHAEVFTTMGSLTSSTEQEGGGGQIWLVYFYTTYTMVSTTVRLLFTFYEVLRKQKEQNCDQSCAELERLTG